MVTIGRMYGRHDHSLSPMETCDECSCLEREAQKRSRGFFKFQILRSPTWGPSGVEMRIIDLAGHGKAKPLRIGIVFEERSVRVAVFMESYRARLTVSGEPVVGR